MSSGGGVLPGQWNATSITALVRKVVCNLLPRLSLGDRSYTGHGHSPRGREGGTPYSVLVAHRSLLKSEPNVASAQNSLRGLKRVNLLSWLHQERLTTPKQLVREQAHSLTIGERLLLLLGLPAYTDYYAKQVISPQIT